MKKFTLLIITVMLVTSFMNAQTLTFKFANPTVIQGAPDVFQFDVEIRASATNTFHRDLQIYFDYNAAAFGSDIVANGKISVTPLSLMEPFGITPSDKYQIVNSADNTSSKFAVITEAGHEMDELPSATYFNEVPATYEGLLRFTIEIDDNTELAGISFDEVLMNGGQYYQDEDSGPPVTPIPTKYADPSLYANDLLNQGLTYDSQTLTFGGTTGWSIWSTYISPVDPEMLALFSPISANVDVVKDGNGLAAYPNYFLNYIGDMIVGDGYQVKLNAVSSLTVYGGKLVPEMTPIELENSWNLVAYTRDNSGNVLTMVTDITASVDVIKNGGGLAAYPQYFLNYIGNMEPGEGYQYKMNSFEDFAYPSNSKSMGLSNFIAATPEHYNSVLNSGVNHSLLIPENAWDIVPEMGDEIAVFDINGNLVGSSVVQLSSVHVAIWGDDPMTENAENMVEDEEFEIRLWSRATDVEQTVVVSSWIEGDATFESNGVSIAKSVESSILSTGTQVAQNKTALYQNVPNPFNNNSMISFFIPEETKVELLIYDVYGNLVDVLTSQVFEKGTHNIKINSREYRTGTYLYKLVTNNYTDTKFMIVK